jgi:hypothetical protein
MSQLPLGGSDEVVNRMFWVSASRHGLRDEKILNNLVSFLRGGRFIR